ncbi:MAG: hypothetical protein ACHQX1_02610 [Candidatus Micrarchaeales archaeon]
MTTVTTEIALCVAIVILTVFAIVVFISSGSGTLFYAIFVVTTVVMIYTWYKISHAEESAKAEPMQMIPEQKNTQKKRKRKRRA